MNNICYWKQKAAVAQNTNELNRTFNRKLTALLCRCMFFNESSFMSYYEINGGQSRERPQT